MSLLVLAFLLPLLLPPPADIAVFVFCVSRFEFPGGGGCVFVCLFLSWYSFLVFLAGEYGKALRSLRTSLMVDPFFDG